MLFSATLLAICARGNVSNKKITFLTKNDDKIQAHSIFGPLTTGTSAVWSGWSAWGDCNGGKRVRSASCVSPNPQICQGVLTEEQTCTPIEPGKIWSAWGQWSECVDGKRTRSANCISPNPDICMGVLQEQTVIEIEILLKNRKIRRSKRPWKIEILIKKIKILVKNRHFDINIEILRKNRNFEKNSKF